MAQMTRAQKIEETLNAEIAFLKQIHAKYGVKPACTLNLLPDIAGIQRAMENMPIRRAAS